MYIRDKCQDQNNCECYTQLLMNYVLDPSVGMGVKTET